MINTIFRTLLIIGITASFAVTYLIYKTCLSVDTNTLGRSEDASSKAFPYAPDSPDLALTWRLLAWRDENGYIPPNPLGGAISQRNSYLQQQSGPDGFGTDAIAHFNWVSRGPQNVGGRTRSIIVDPNNQNILWAGSVSGGVWKSIDRGATWLPMNGDLQNYAIASLAMDPNDSNVLYAGTGEGFFGLGELQGPGIFKTNNGGVTWNYVDTGAGYLYAVNRIAVANNNGSTWILASTRIGILRSTDGGNNWNPVLPAYSQDVAFNPNDPMKAVAQIITNDTNYAKYSTDGGATWNSPQIIGGKGGTIFSVPGSLSRIEFAWANSGNALYAMHPIAGGGVVSYSSDGGATFTQRTAHSNDPIYPIDPSYYHNALWVSPTNPNFLIFGGQVVMRSTDGGQNFDRINTPRFISDQPHNDIHSVVPDLGFSSTNKRAYVCSDGGIYYTDDITTAGQSAGWHQLNTTFQTTQFYGAAAGNIASGLMFGGTQDNSSLRLVAGNSNAKITNAGGDGGFAAVDPNNTSRCYGELPTLKLYRITDCTQQTSLDLVAEEIHQGLLDTETHAHFIAPFVLDTNDTTGSRMLAGGLSLWRTNNLTDPGQPAWSQIKTRGGPDDDLDRITAIAIAPGHSNIIFVGQTNGKLFKTTNGLDPIPTWTPIDDNASNNPLPNRYLTRILIDKDNSDVVYVAFGGFEKEDNLQMNQHGGVGAWTDITGGGPCGQAGLPCVPIRGIARHPNDANKLYVGTEMGVYAGQYAFNTWTWAPVMEGPANVSVDELVFVPNSTTLMAATYGRGIWTTDVTSPLLPHHVANDFDGDGRSDISVFRPSSATWYIMPSLRPTPPQQFGLSTDQLAAGDYDGDGKTDIGVFRSSNATWYWLNSSDGTFHGVQYGLNGDTPVPADYDGDGRTDQAVFRPSDGTWYINQSTYGPISIPWGISTDKPFPADFDGDGKADLGIFRPSGGLWYLYDSSGKNWGTQFGLQDDIPVAADYDGDGKADVAVFRPSNGVWYINGSQRGFYFIPWSSSNPMTDVPVPGDYDGDGKADVGVFTTTGDWYIQESMMGMYRVHFGANGDLPVERRTNP